MLRSMLTALALVGALPTAAAAQDPAPYLAEGKIREVTGPGRSRAMLVTDDRRSFTLESESAALREELVRLSGVRVRLRAQPRATDAPEGVPLQVEAYEILDVGGGVVPTIGHLALLEAGTERRLIFVTEDGRASLLPKTWTDRLVSHVGAKIWLVGQKDKDELRVKRFSILRVPPKGAATPPKGP